MDPKTYTLSEYNTAVSSHLVSRDPMENIYIRLYNSIVKINMDNYGIIKYKIHGYLKYSTYNIFIDTIIMYLIRLVDIYKHIIISCHYHSTNLIGK